MQILYFTSAQWYFLSTQYLLFAWFPKLLSLQIRELLVLNGFVDKNWKMIHLFHWIDWSRTVDIITFTTETLPLSLQSHFNDNWTEQQMHCPYLSHKLQIPESLFNLPTAWNIYYMACGSQLVCLLQLLTFLTCHTNEQKNETLIKWFDMNCYSGSEVNGNVVVL